MSRESLINWNEYDIYEDGRIYSKSYNKNRFLKGTIDEDGYANLFLKCIDNKIRNFKWHRVIYTYFNGDIPEGYQVNHIDENKQNNALNNLNLMTPKENINHGTCIERRVAKQSKPVEALDKDGNVVKRFSSTCEAGRNGFDQGSVIRCCRGLRRTCGGYAWRYA